MHNIYGLMKRRSNRGTGAMWLWKYLYIVDRTYIHHTGGALQWWAVQIYLVCSVEPGSQTLTLTRQNVGSGDSSGINTEPENLSTFITLYIHDENNIQCLKPQRSVLCASVVFKNSKCTCTCSELCYRFSLGFKNSECTRIHDLHCAALTASKI